MFCTNPHHGDTEGIENGIGTISFAQFKITSVTSVPLWWILNILPMGEDLGFTGHDQALRIYHLRLTIQLYFDPKCCLDIIHSALFCVK